jgi:hypothetical protein
MFELDVSLIPAGVGLDAIEVFRDGVAAPTCTGTPGTADPDPCVLSRTLQPDGDLVIVVLSSHASLWTFGIRACPPNPAAGCIGAAKAQVVVNERKAGREKLKIALKSLVPAVAQNQFGDPVVGTTRYAVCLYDQADGLVGAMSVARAGDDCGSKPCWKTSATGFKFTDKNGGSNGVVRMVFKAGDPGKGSLLVTGKNNEPKGQTALPTGIAAALQDDRGITVQVATSDAACFGVALSTVKKADGLLFQAIAP